MASLYRNVHARCASRGYASQALSIPRPCAVSARPRCKFRTGRGTASPDGYRAAIGTGRALGRSMAPSPQALVHQLLASRLRIDETSIRDTDRFDDLGLDPLDLLFVVLRLDRFDRGDGEFPLYALEHAATVGDLVDLVALWLQRDTMPSSVA
jgi:acyl carrier protein